MDNEHQFLNYSRGCCMDACLDQIQWDNGKKGINIFLEGEYKVVDRAGLRSILGDVERALFSYSMVDMDNNNPGNNNKLCGIKGAYS